MFLSKHLSVLEENIPITAPQKRLREDNVDEPPAKKTKVVEPDSEIGAQGLGLDSKLGSIAKESFDDLFPSFKHVATILFVLGKLARRGKDSYHRRKRP